MADSTHQAGVLSRLVGAAGAVLIILGCYPPVSAGAVLGFVVYAPLLAWLDRSRTGRGAFAIGFAVGAAKVLVLGNWFAASLARPLLALGLGALCFGLSWGLAAWLQWLLLRRASLPLLIWAVIPTLEYVWQANPWCPIGYLTTPHAIADNLWFAQLVEMTGHTGLSLVLCASSWWAMQIARQHGRGLLLWLACVAALHGLGAGRLAAWQHLEGETMPVAIVQEYAPRNREGDSVGDKEELFQRIRDAVAQGSPRLLFLPEETLDEPQALPGVLVESSRPTPAELGRLLAEFPDGPGHAIAGVTIGVDKGIYRNSVALIEAGGGTIGLVDKQYAAPVGEMVPLEGIPGLERLGQALSEAEGTLRSQTTDSKLECPGGPTLAVAVCHEQMFPDVWKRRGLTTLAGVDLQVIVADTRWFGYSEQERRLSRAARRLLAIRYRRPLLYVANGGSEWFSASGSLRAAVDARDRSATFHLNLYGRAPQMPEVIPAWFVPAFSAIAIGIWWRFRGKGPLPKTAPGMPQWSA